MSAHSPAPPAARTVRIARTVSAPAAFTGAWALLRAAAALPAALAVTLPGGLAAAASGQETLLFLTAVTGLAGAALLAVALPLARCSAGAWAAGAGLLFGLLALSVASYVLLRRVDWIGTLAAAITLLALLAPPVREAFLA